MSYKTQNLITPLIWVWVPIVTDPESKSEVGSRLSSHLVRASSWSNLMQTWSHSFFWASAVMPKSWQETWSVWEWLLLMNMGQHLESQDWMYVPNQNREENVMRLTHLASWYQWDAEEPSSRTQPCCHGCAHDLMSHCHQGQKMNHESWWWRHHWKEKVK